MMAKDSLNGLKAEVYDAGVQNLFTWCNNCLNFHEDYEGKLFEVRHNAKYSFTLFFFLIAKQCSLS
jgi:hypothetical protein